MCWKLKICGAESYISSQVNKTKVSSLKGHTSTYQKGGYARRILLGGGERRRRRTKSVTHSICHDCNTFPPSRADNSHIQKPKPK